MCSNVIFLLGPSTSSDAKLCYDKRLEIAVPAARHAGSARIRDATRPRFLCRALGAPWNSRPFLPLPSLADGGSVWPVDLCCDPLLGGGGGAFATKRRRNEAQIFKELVSTVAELAKTVQELKGSNPGPHPRVRRPRRPKPAEPPCWHSCVSVCRPV